MLKRFSVRLQQRSYPVYIGVHGLQHLGKMLSKHRLQGIACVVTQKDIWSSWGPSVKDRFSQFNLPYKIHILNPKLKSEQMKSMKEVLKLIETCSSLDGRGRGIYLVALGGGVVGDVTGFVASIYRRGIPYVQIPTTLTAQVDSSIGGKTGVDLPEGKNLLGSIYQPRFVMIDPDFLRTLPERFYRDGLAEVVKYALIRDKGLFHYLEKNKQAVMDRQMPYLVKILSACVKIKAKVVSRDEFDKKDIRIILNFGHTIGHALEAATAYGTYTHGQAISVGMMCALELSETLCVLKDPSLIRRSEQLLNDFGLPVMMDHKVNPKVVMNAVDFDKKNIDGVNRFVLMERLSKTILHQAVPKSVVYQHLMKRRT